MSSAADRDQSQDEDEAAAAAAFADDWAGDGDAPDGDGGDWCDDGDDEDLSQALDDNSSAAVVFRQPDLVERILFQLPIRDLLQSASLVCKSWESVISNESFVPWKKCYHRFALHHSLVGDPPHAVDFAGHLRDQTPVFRSSIKHLLPEGGDKVQHLSAQELVLPFVVAYAGHVFAESDAELSAVERHSKRKVAELFVDRCFPATPNDDTSPKKGRAAASIVALCAAVEDAWDVVELVRLFHLSREASVSRLMEVLHYAALAFKYCSRNHRLPVRYHFNVAQAVYFFENNSNLRWANQPATPSPGPSPSKRQRTLHSFGVVSSVARGFAPTSEQAAVVNHQIDVSSSDVVKIVAFAGTGKTTTLVRLCEQNPHLNFLVVMCSTAHSLAFDPRYRPKIAEIKPKFLIKLLGDDPGKHPVFRRAGIVSKTIQKFLSSPDEEISSDHVPPVWREEPVDSQLSEVTVRDARSIWKRMKDPNDKQVRIPHDGYLKIWQLSRPNLREQIPHDVLLVDEGQDMNPAMMDVFQRQQTPRFIVGDPHQQIYLFRGAVNALEMVDSARTYHLTQSFRFGPEVAFVANCCLNKLKNEDRRTLFGGRYVDSLVNAREQRGRPRVAFIARTNRGLLDQAINLISKGEGPIQKTGYFQGGISSYNLDDYVDMWHLKSGRKDLMRSGSRFSFYKSFEELNSYAMNAEDLELQGKIQAVRHYGESIVGHVRKLKQHCSSSIVTPDFVFTTAHKAKGLEWDDVSLLDDFDSAFMSSNRGSEDEKNVLYVALTRARRRLRLSPSVWRLLTRASYSTEALTVLPPDVGFRCKQCRKTVNPELEEAEGGTLALRAKAVDCASFAAGFACRQCSWQRRRSNGLPALTLVVPTPSSAGLTATTIFADENRQALANVLGRPAGHEGSYFGYVQGAGGVQLIPQVFPLLHPGFGFPDSSDGDESDGEESDGEASDVEDSDGEDFDEEESDEEDLDGEESD